MLTKEGLAVWNMEYRRLGNGGGWPVTFEDVAAGTGHVDLITPETAAWTVFKNAVFALLKRA